MGCVSGQCKWRGRLTIDLECVRLAALDQMYTARFGTASHSAPENRRRHIHLIRLPGRIETADPRAATVHRIGAAGLGRFRESTPCLSPTDASQCSFIRLTGFMPT